MINIDYQQIILWVLIVLAAGFIGQFGKSFATHLIALARKKKSLSETEKQGITAKQQEEGKSPAAVSETKTGAQAKTDKKALKAMIKEKKKQL
ncbi:MAG: hypothetical protein ABFD82_02705 [Syntrophaceae bacterium]